MNWVIKYLHELVLKCTVKDSCERVFDRLQADCELLQVELWLLYLLLVINQSVWLIFSFKLNLLSAIIFITMIKTLSVTQRHLMLSIKLRIHVDLSKVNIDLRMCLLVDYL